jgi:hypothetical protein
MPWRFVGRTEQIQRARCALEAGGGPLVIAGEPGMGRTSMLSRILSDVAAGRDEIVLIRPSGDVPLAALRAGFLHSLPPSATLSDVVAAIAGHAAGRRLIIAADDAHLMDHPSLLALREASRTGCALLLVTHAISASIPARPDPTECLSYEDGLQKLVLLPLSVDEVAAALAGAIGMPMAQAAVEAVQAATGGKPRLLHELIVENRLAECMAREGERWHIGVPGWPGSVIRTYSGAERLIEATWNAWQKLAVERADQLCRLALWFGIRDQIAPVWAALLMLQGHADACIDFLDSLSAEGVAATPQLALIKALTLALGLGRAQDAADILLSAASNGQESHAALAYRAWLLAVTGHGTAAAAALRAIDRTDPDTALFVHAARGALTRLGGPRAESVFHLRRALAAAEGCGNWCPWMRPYLQASLIDALLLSGRREEALSVARRFHAHEPGSGWEVVVALEALFSRSAKEVADPATVTAA